MKRYRLIFALMAALIVSSGCTVYQTAPAYGHEPPPRVVVSQPEYLYIIPSYGVYFVPDISAEVFFVNGRWYYSVRGVWYWGTSYRGPWTHIEIRYIPRQLRKLPRDYRTRYRHKYYQVPYGHWKRRYQEVPPGSKSGSPPYMEKYKNNIYLNPRDHDVIFHDGAWYRKYKGLWYEGKSNAGPWRYREMEKLPKTIKKLPPEYRQREPGKPAEQVPWWKLEKKYKKKMEKRDREWGDY